ncbi:hypothetical protein [Corynebacterium liangguodongii]|uniref:Uncharacterized protein n=1 Tax=Corynebacterium liangguodongii TaxID=2079535 RepID=A0A2S0WDT7_9CORY|nr:hypothetical protein [Corynebacterium liangguodongii]AWB83943.1 hypothetical protein C3E79_05160 [Corynebacterium liangguodongii]PWB99082.1 hypothetical protein DF219_08810 [Corynebacterium liangguodongii]
MKTTITRAFVGAVAAAALSFAAAPAAHAQTTDTAETTDQVADTSPIIGVYSAMSDFLSCTYYPMRPWCPNAPDYA